jgi:hypothetical protein
MLAIAYVAAGLHLVRILVSSALPDRSGFSNFGGVTGFVARQPTVGTCHRFEFLKSLNASPSTQAPWPLGHAMTGDLLSACDTNCASHDGQ